MKLIFGLMLLKTAACVERFCWFNQGGPCYAALGDKLNLLMVVADASKYDLNIQKTISNTEKDPFCRVRNNTMKKNQCDLFNKRSEVSVINGILIINGVIRADSGTYRLILEDSDGTETSADLQVIVEGLEVNCWFNQSDPCYAALGHKLNLLMVDTSRYDLTIKKIMSSTQDDPVCKIKKGTIKKNECDLFNNRPEVSVIIGILIINGVIRADSGTYRLKLEGSDGTETSRDLQVIVEAPIGSVEVSIICCSSGVMRASCSSDGDPLLFSWTLNGDPLMDGNIIDLDEGTDGNISCSVKNHVSHRQKTVSVKHCPETSASLVHVLVWCFQLMFLLGLLGGFHIYMRHTSGKKQEDQQVRMSRFREGHEHTAED